MSKSEWPARLTAVIAAEVRRYRKARGMSVRQLSDEVGRCGLAIAQPVLSNLELGRRETISVPELLALAAALRVTPALLVFPVGTDVDLEILPGRPADPWTAYRWFVGDLCLTPGEREQQVRNLMEGADVVDAFRRHDRAVAGYLSFRKANPDAAQAYLNSLVIAREDIRRNGWHLPSIPSDVATEVATEEAKLRHQFEVWDEQLDGRAP